MIGPHLIPAEVVPAAPAVGGVALAAAALFTFLAFLVCAGLRQAWAASIGYGLRWVASEIRDVGIPTGFFGHIHPFGVVADALESVDHHIAHALAVAALNTEHAAVYLWHTAAAIFVWTGQEIARLANDTLHFAEGLYAHTLPKWRREILHTAEHAADVSIARLRRTEHAAHEKLSRAIGAAEAKALSAVRAVAGTLDQVIPQVHGLERDFTGLKKRLEKLEKLLAPGAIVALIGATVFTHFGLEWLRCNSNPFKNNRNACGLWTVLGRVLELAGFLTIAFDFKAFVSAAEFVASGIGEAVAKIEGEFGLALPPLPPPEE